VHHTSEHRHDFLTTLERLKIFIDNNQFSQNDDINIEVQKCLIDTVNQYELTLQESIFSKESFIYALLTFVQQVILVQSKKTYENEKPGDEQIAKGIELLQRIINIPSRSENVYAISHIARGLLYVERKRYNRALNDFNCALDILKQMLPDNGMCECMKRHYRDCALTPDDTVFVKNNYWAWWLTIIVHIFRGNVYHDQQHYKRAYEIYCIPARMLSKQNDFRSTIKDIQGIEHEHLTGWVVFRCYAQKGKALIELGNLPEALKWLFMAMREILLLQSSSGLPDDITSLDSIIEFFDNIRIQGRINKVDVWDTISGSITIQEINSFFTSSSKKYDKHKSEYINNICYCLNVLMVKKEDLSPLDYALDYLLALVDSAIAFDKGNIYAHFNKLLLFGLHRKGQVNAQMKKDFYDELMNRLKKDPDHSDRILAVSALFGYVDNMDPADPIREKVFLKLITNFNNIVSAPSKFYSNILRSRCIDSKTSKVIVLRRWNSFTPIVPRPRADEALGGGYLLIHRGKGIAIDPGFNFIHNLYGAGYSINDIDAIFVTHSHIDHCDDLDALLTLMFERNCYAEDLKAIGHGLLNDRKDLQPHQVDLFVNDGSIRKYSWLKPHTDVIKRVYLLTAPRIGDWADGDNPEIDISSEYGLTLSILRANHKDFISPMSSVGLKFRLTMDEDHEKTQIVVTFSGDTSCKGGDGKEDAELIKQYNDSHLLFLHIGDYNFKELSLGRSSNSFNNLIAYGNVFDLARNAFLLGVREKHIKNHEEQTEEDAKKMIISALFREDEFNSNHLGFNGVCKVIKSLGQNIDSPDKRCLTVISEFPEELGSWRHAVSKCIQVELHKQRNMNLRCLTGDIGMEILLENAGVKVKCTKCAENNEKNDTGRCFHDFARIDETCIRAEQMKMVYYCENHKSKMTKEIQEFILFTE
jgi:tetratricopeptide (TPR) repeat protein